MLPLELVYKHFARKLDVRADFCGAKHPLAQFESGRPAAYTRARISQPKRSAALIERTPSTCASVLTVAEVECNLVRLAREQTISAKTYGKAQKKLAKDVDLFIIRELTLDLCLSGQFPAIKTPRTSDLLHLRTALWFKANGGLKSFLSLDARQLDAAQELGLECA